MKTYELLCLVAAWTMCIDTSLAGNINGSDVSFANKDTPTNTTITRDAKKQTVNGSSLNRIEMGWHFPLPTPLLRGSRVYAAPSVRCDAAARLVVAFQTGKSSFVNFARIGSGGDVKMVQTQVRSCLAPIMGRGPNDGLVCGVLLCSMKLSSMMRSVGEAAWMHWNDSGEASMQLLGWKSKSVPVLEFFDGVTFVVYVSDNSRIRWRSLQPGDAEWSEASDLAAADANADTDLAPSLQRFEDKLVCMWSKKGSNSIVYSIRRRGTSAGTGGWSVPVLLNVRSPTAPRLAVFKKRLYVAFECGERHRLRWMHSLDANCGNWTHAMSTLLCAPNSFALVEHNNTLMCLLPSSNALLASEARNLDVNPQSWMGDMSALLSDMRLRDVALPGTHDSGTYRISSNSELSPDGQDWYSHVARIPFLRSALYRIVSSWAKTQERTAYEQFCDGIRYFDLRVCARPDLDGALWIVHSMFSLPLADILQDARRFLDEHPNEVIIFDLNHLYRMGDREHDACVNLFRKELGAKLAPSSVGINVTLQKLWQNRHQAIVLYNDDGAANVHDVLWSGNLINSLWPNAQNCGTLKTWIDDLLKNGRDHRFHVVQGLLTPDTTMITKGVGPSCPGSLLKLADGVNEDVLHWLSSEWAQQVVAPLNIVIVDRYDWNGNALVAVLLHLNRLRGVGRL